MADRRMTLADEENLFFASRLLSRGIDLVSVVQALVVAEYLSFSAAASALGVRQSGVSKRIRLLEENLGVTLFERGLSNGVQKGPPIGVEEGPPFRII